MAVSRKLKVFLCHASQDKPAVRELYRRLRSEDWIDPWLDEEALLPGQDWDLEIEKAVEAADAVIVCLSNRSVTKEGYVQKELRKVLDIALEKPEETIFIVPVRLDECELPRRLRPWHYVDYFPAHQREHAYKRLHQALNLRFEQLQPSRAGPPASPGTDDGAALLEEQIEGEKPIKQNIVANIARTFQTTGSGAVDVGSSVLLIIYFAMAALDGLTPSSDVQEGLLAISAILAGIALVRRRQIPASLTFKIALIVYLLIYGSGYRLQDIISFANYIAGAAAVVAGVSVAISARLPRKQAMYSSISFAVFLFLVGIYEIATNISYSTFTNIVETIIFITSIVASIFLALDL